MNTPKDPFEPLPNAKKVGPRPNNRNVMPLNQLKDPTAAANAMRLKGLETRRKQAAMREEMKLKMKAEVQAFKELQKEGYTLDPKDVLQMELQKAIQIEDGDNAVFIADKLMKYQYPTLRAEERTNVTADIKLEDMSEDEIREKLDLLRNKPS